MPAQAVLTAGEREDGTGEVEGDEVFAGSVKSRSEAWGVTHSRAQTSGRYSSAVSKPAPLEIGNTDASFASATL